MSPPGLPDIRIELRVLLPFPGAHNCQDHPHLVGWLVQKGAVNYLAFGLGVPQHGWVVGSFKVCKVALSIHFGILWTIIYMQCACAQILKQWNVHPPTSPTKRHRSPSSCFQSSTYCWQCIVNGVNIDCWQGSKPEENKECNKCKKASLHHCNALVNYSSEIIPSEMEVCSIDTLCSAIVAVQCAVESGVRCALQNCALCIVRQKYNIPFA